ncbi:MAG TPA: RcnB family protein, partial [Sphingobium sp.]|nr:RcnB family protein [Sphingobium sp.]
NKLIKAMLAVSALATSLPAMAQPEWNRGRGGQERHGDPRPGTESIRQRQSVIPAPVPPQERGRWPRGDGARADRAPTAPVPAPRAERQRRDWDGNRGQWNRSDGDARRQWQDRDRRRDNDDNNRAHGRDWRRDRQDDNRWQGRDWRRDRPDDNRWRERDRNYGVVAPNWRDNDRSRWERNRWADQRRWDRDWRRDNRYDWSRHRHHNRHIYRLPRYHVPYGWSYGYRPFSIGIYLNSLLFSDDYWIDDPWTYRLPPAYGSLRWIRYYDDALLVDIRDGYVVDVIRNFFW